MSSFPTLKTGAVLQYPAQKSFQFSTAIVRYIDGSEQRFPSYQTPIHRWVVRLDMLDESELHQVQEFFRTQGGASEAFAFTDPWDGTGYSSCRVEEDEMVSVLTDVSSGRTSLMIRENRS